ncbi:oligosaccharide flippase family protein [Halorussus aquaticus]|uniref:Oligosaccharide flippase family protein n=1 Tax=Halorussus aquaticus TaxID=2953748 RepID=A0ABD5Q5Q5_9EURY|nr:oligosaccharide flippase family protein [Halorussus aquaticus]
MSDASSELERLISSAVLVFVGTLFGAGSKLLERVIIGRFLSVDVYGEVSVLLSLMSVCVVASLFGLVQGVPRYMSRDEDPAVKRGTWWSGTSISLALSAVVTILLVANAGVLTEYFLDGQVGHATVQLLLLSVPFVVGLRIVVAGIRGMENTNFRVLVNDAFYPGLRILLLTVLLLAGVGSAAVGQAYLFASAAAFLLGALLLHRLVPLVGPVETDVNELVRFSVPLMLSSIFDVMLLRTDTLLLGLLSTSFAAGLYNAAYPLAHGLLIVLRAFGYLYLPVASRLDANSKRDSMERVYQMTTKWIVVVTFPLLALLLVYPETVLALLFGESYRPATLALVVLAAGFFVNAFFGRNIETLSALGDTRTVFVGNAAAFVFNVVFNVVFIPVYGIEGAAVISALSFTIQNLYVNGILWRRFSIKPFTVGSYRLFLTLSGAILFMYLLKAVVNVRPRVLVPVYALSLAGVLCAIAVVTCLETEDLLLVSYMEDKLGVDLRFVHRFVRR